MAHPEAETLVWEGGEHPFFLRIGELRALQKRCEAGPLAIYMRLVSSSWLVDDVIETVRLGLIGGGMDDRAARDMVDHHIHDKRGALVAHVPLACLILHHSVVDGGDKDDPVGKPDPATTPETMTPETTTPTD